MRRALVIVFACLALVVAGVAGATRVRWQGGLGGEYGSAVGMPVRVGTPFSVSMTLLRPGRRVSIDSVRLNSPTGGVVLVGTLVGGRSMSFERAFPPQSVGGRLRTATGAVVPARTRSILVLGLRATRPGPFRVRGADVLYRERWHGIDLRRRAHVGVEIDGCAVRTDAAVPSCAVPEPLGR